MAVERGATGGRRPRHGEPPKLDVTLPNTNLTPCSYFLYRWGWRFLLWEPPQQNASNHKTHPVLRFRVWGALSPWGCIPPSSPAANSAGAPCPCADAQRKLGIGILRFVKEVPADKAFYDAGAPRCPRTSPPAASTHRRPRRTRYTRPVRPSYYPSTLTNLMNCLGMCCKASADLNTAFVLLNRYLDISEAVGAREPCHPPQPASPAFFQRTLAC